ncbi:Phosphatidylethanolamine-binding protein [Sphingomonas antarctica]|uniref:YbhB/YbcL family Raf kinase inhibitor-like protein n=1 Tax=Sphingomonas antarctica TaxID=2040274 RepID=UPI0039ED16F6
MLEHVPHWLGQLLRNARAGHDKLVILDIAQGTPKIDLSSPAFADGGRLPERFTADGAGVSPPLVWGVLPEGTASLALIVEDPGAPFPDPISHAVMWRIPPETQHLAEGAIVADGAGDADGDVGKNSRRAEGWLPPDPPNGHGVHDYVFQLFALSSEPELAANPQRKDLVAAITGRVLAAGVLTGTYSRGEDDAGRPEAGGAVVTA